MTVTPLRRTAFVIAAAATIPVATAAPALAAAPEGWSDPEEVGLVEMLVVVAGLPILIGLAIVLAVYVPAMTRGERVAPGAETPDQWFGGPRRDAGELEAAPESSTTGGASGSW